MKRRNFLSAGLLPVVVTAAVGGITAPAWATRLPVVQVYKSPTCGCCSAWVDHLKANGFEVRVTDLDDTGAARRRLGMPERLGSCHTATVAGYVIEGHVPAADIARLLKDRPKALGLAVPGMPIGSPGMEAGPRQDRYEVLLVQKSGAHTVFNRYPQAPGTTKPTAPTPASTKD